MRDPLPRGHSLNEGCDERVDYIFEGDWVLSPFDRVDEGHA